MTWLVIIVCIVCSSFVLWRQGKTLAELVKQLNSEKDANSSLRQKVSDVSGGMRDSLREMQNFLGTQDRQLSNLQSQLKDVPTKTLNVIQGSVNTTSGKMGELIGFLKLKSDYDRLIPINDIVDFLAIKFPDENSLGCIEFMDVKTGKNARLNDDQRKLKQMIEENKDCISFTVVNIKAT